MRQATIDRNTTETRIHVAVNLDGTGRYAVQTGVGFLDHMLEQLSRHSLVDLDVKAEGDLHIDAHHTTEDSGIAIGQAVAKALGDRTGISRYGSALIPMDETLTRVAIDLSNRPYLVWKVRFFQRQAGQHGYRAVQGMVPGLRPGGRAPPCMSRRCTARTTITSSNRASRGWPGPCARR